MLIKDLKDKKVAVWGMGAEGKQAVLYLVEHKITDKIVLLNDTEVEVPEGLEKFPLAWGENIANFLDGVDVIIRSPGVSIYKAELVAARNCGIKFTSVTDLCLNEFLARPNCKVIGVSGSKGKSISVSALAYILQNMGYKVALGGNIGKPMIELLDGEYDFIVEEFSSYQASDLTASPQIAMFTNLFSVHTDWHHGHENYCRDKVHLIANQKSGDVYFANARNEQLMQYTAEYPENRHLYDDMSGFHAEGSDFYFQDKKLFALDDIKLFGNHNLDNLAGVFSILQYLKLDIVKACEILKTFETLPHRLQKVAVKNGVMFINDSISTAPEAAVSAMKSFGGNLIFISGGQDNQQDYRDYAQTVEAFSNIKMVIALFQTGPQIAQTLRDVVKRSDFELVETDSLENAVSIAYKKLQLLGGGTVLFSPTNPSFGFYKNFIERGNHFIQIVNAL